MTTVIARIGTMFTPSNFLRNLVHSVPRLSETWEARECILEMRGAGYRNWRQTEWVGFYLEFIVESVAVPGVAHFRLVEGNTTFDGCAGKVVIDYKASVIGASAIILNDKSAIEKVLSTYGELGYVTVRGHANLEAGAEIESWRRKVVGVSNYVDAGSAIGRRHRRIKSDFTPLVLLYLGIRRENLHLLRVFNQGRNSNGRPRNVKYMLPIGSLDSLTVASLLLKEGGKSK